MDTNTLAIIIVAAVLGLAALIVALIAFAVACAVLLSAGRYPKAHTYSTLNGYEDAMAVLGRLKAEAEASERLLVGLANYAQDIITEVKQGPNVYDRERPSRLDQYMPKKNRDD